MRRAIMKEYIVNCPCCNNKISILINDSGEANVFLLDENNISHDELSRKYGIELGVRESGVSKK